MKKGELVLISWIVGVVLLINFVSAVRINEVMAKTPEFVEIYNEGNRMLDLTEWKIKDASSSVDEITCYNILNCSLVIDYSYFIIIGRNTNISQITDNLIHHFYVEDLVIANSLNDDGDNITFFNSSFSTSFLWNNSQTGKSWQFYNGSWIEAEPTPAAQNYNPPAENPPDNNGDGGEEDEISLEIDWDEDDIINGEEFEINVKAYNLSDKKYDVKIRIEFEENSTIISEIYDEENDTWQSGYYYIDEILKGHGDESETFDLRIKEEYENFKGDAKIFFKIRTSGWSLEIEKDIEILESLPEKQEEEPSEIIVKKSTEQETTSIITGEIIKLGQSGSAEETENIKSKEILYESRNEKIKKSAVYCFSLLCVIFVIILVFKKEIKILKNPKEKRKNGR